MLQIYGRRSSINVQKVIWCLAELGLTEGRDYQRIEAGLEFGVNNTPDYLRLNFNGLVPTLVDGDFVLWESNSIARYLASVHGDHTLLPAEPKARADVERWMDWQLATLWATLRLTFLGLTRTPEPKRDYAAIKAAFADGTKMLGWVNDHLSTRPFLSGSNFTLADLTVGLSAHRWLILSTKFSDVLGPSPELPAMLAWHDKLIKRPGFQLTVN